MPARPLFQDDRDNIRWYLRNPTFRPYHPELETLRGERARIARENRENRAASRQLARDDARNRLGTVA